MAALGVGGALTATSGSQRAIFLLLGLCGGVSAIAQIGRDDGRCRLAASGSRGQYRPEVPQRERPDGRVISPWLWAWNALLMAVGVFTVWLGPTWLGILLLTLPVFGMAPLVLEDRRRRRGDGA